MHNSNMFESDTESEVQEKGHIVHSCLHVEVSEL